MISREHVWNLSMIDLLKQFCGMFKRERDVIIFYLKQYDIWNPIYMMFNLFSGCRCQILMHVMHRNPIHYVDTRSYFFIMRRRLTIGL